MNTPRLYLMVLCVLMLGLHAACDPEPDSPNEPDVDMSMMTTEDAREDLKVVQDMLTDLPDVGEEMGSPVPDLSVADLGMDMQDMRSEPMLQPLPDLSTYEGCAPFVKMGPFTAGVTTLMIDGSPVEVFYPSSAQPDPNAARATYDLREWLPEDARLKIPDTEPTTYEMMAYRDIELDRSTPRPVVLFSHGFAGYRLQSSFLLSHLASWGMVVASAEHPGRGLAAVLTESLSGGRDVEVISGVLSELEVLNEEGSGSMFSGALDTDRVAMSGHSAGGAAAIELGQALPDRFATVIGYTPAVKSLQTMEFLDALLGRKLFISGSKDGLTTARDITSYSQMQEPDWRHLVIDRAGHLAFTDICVIGREKGGILKIAEASGVEVPLFVTLLATDGCRRNDLRAEIAWPMIAHFSVAELIDVFGMSEDMAPTYLEQEAATCFGELAKSYEIEAISP